MGFEDVIRTGVATAASVTASLQVVVQHASWIGVRGQGEPLFTAFIGRRALVEQKASSLRNASGETVVSRAKLTLLDPIVRQGADGRREAIDPRDLFILPDGTTGPILAVNGLLDPSTGLPYLLEVYLG